MAMSHQSLSLCSSSRAAQSHAAIQIDVVKGRTKIHSHLQVCMPLSPGVYSEDYVTVGPHGSTGFRWPGLKGYLMRPLRWFFQLSLSSSFYCAL